jgi:hypothetical protein
MDVGVPLARWSVPDLHREVVTRGLVATISETTLWRWLDADAIRPCRHRSWLFPRDPDFAERAAPVLDLYAGRWHGRRLEPQDYVISADEKTSAACQLAQPDRDLLLDRPTEGPHAERLRLAGGARTLSAGLPGPVPGHRDAVLLDLHARGLASTVGPTRGHRHRTAGRVSVENTSP